MSKNVTLEDSFLGNITLAEIFQSNDNSSEVLSFGTTTFEPPETSPRLASVLPPEHPSSSTISNTTSSNLSAIAVILSDSTMSTTHPPEVTWKVNYDIDLDDWDRAVIIAGVAAFLIVVLIVLICSLRPGCLLYALCPLDYGDGCKKTKFPAPVYGSMDDPVFEKVSFNGKANGHSEHLRQSVPKTRVLGCPIPSFHNNNKMPRSSSEHSDWSDMSSPEMIEMKNEVQTKSRKPHRTSDYSSSTSSVIYPVQPESRLAYGLTFDRAHSRLYIRVIQLGNFRVTDPDGALSPYVKVRVYRTPRHFFTFKLKSVKELPLNQLEVEMQTRIQRRTDNPVFNEYFEMIVEDPDVTAYTVKFLVCDYDKFSRHVVVGEVMVELSKVDLSSAEEVLFNNLIEPYHEDNLGELHVALMYLPTAEKLHVSILNARGLCALEAPKRHTDAVVKLVLMYDGRPLKKTKTTPRTNDSCPTFNENFVFDVPAYQLDKVYFHLAVIAIEKDREDSRHLLGRVYIGVNFNTDAKAQWLEMVHNARKQVACWHKLHS